MRHDGKPASGLSRARRFDGGVQRQQVGLERDLVNDLDDLADLLRRVGNRVHSIRHGFHFLLSDIGKVRSLPDELIGSAGALGAVFDLAIRALQIAGNFFDGGGLFLRARRQVLAHRPHLVYRLRDLGDGEVGLPDRVVQSHQRRL